jgi:hypothetical protein
MKIVSANGKKKIVITRKEWEAIGKMAQWNSDGIELSEQDRKNLEEGSRQRYEDGRGHAKAMDRSMELQSEILHLELKIDSFKRADSPYCRRELPGLRQRLKEMKRELGDVGEKLGMSTKRKIEAADTGHNGTYVATDSIYYKSAAPFLRKDETIEVVQSLKNDIRYRTPASPTIFKIPIGNFTRWIEKGLLERRQP